MSSRAYFWFVVSFWLSMMSWLVTSKVLPSLLGGQPPDYEASLSLNSAKASPVFWRISWQDRRIGTAISQVVQRIGGGTSLRHVVHFEQMPLGAMVSEGFGLLGSVIKPLLGDDRNLEVGMQLATELRFDERRRFQEFQTVFDIGDMEGFLQVAGKSTERRKLEVTTQFGPTADGQKGRTLRHEIGLPGNSLVNDAFAPRPELRNLRVGQSWTIPVYRPFPPNSTVQIVKAVAERLDVIVWDGRDVETILVLYREDAGSGLHASRDPMLKEWVRADGLVLQQEIRFSDLRVMFERQTTPTSPAELEKLNPLLHPRLWIH